MHLLPSADRVCVEPASGRRSEPHDEVGLRAWNQDAWQVAIALVHVQRRDG